MKAKEQGGRPIPPRKDSQKEMDKLADELFTHIFDDLPECLAGKPLASEDK